MLSNLDGKAGKYSSDDPTEPFVPSYFISDGRANGYNFQPPVKRQTREPAPKYAITIGDLIIIKN